MTSVWIGVKMEFVILFDSKFSIIPMDIKKQIAALLCCSSSRITTRFHNTQSQIGSSDCRGFAVAFATDLAFGLNPASHHYEQDELRPHFIECLKSEQMAPFPSKKHPTRKAEDRVFVCILSLPHARWWWGTDGSVHWLQGMVPWVMWKHCPKDDSMTGNVKCALLGSNSLLSWGCPLTVAIQFINGPYLNVCM